MAKSTINLKSTVVESREQRLGTIIAWDGKASDLARLSKYSYQQGCSGKSSSSCELCEQKGPFSQGTSCSEFMVACQAGLVRDAVLIEHSPVGCAVNQVLMNFIFRGGLALRNLPVENLHIHCSNLQEEDMVFGGAEKLQNAIQVVWDRYHPQAIFISSSCATAIIGDDIDGIASEAQEQLSIPVVPIHCEGFRSKHWSTGFDSSQHGILRQIVRKNPKKQEDLINIIILYGSDVFTSLFAELNLRVNFAVDLASVADLEQLSEAAATASFCYTLSSYLAAVLEQEFGVPEIKAPQPYGFPGTDAWLREIGRVTHRETLVEKYIAKERTRVLPQIQGLREKLKGIKGYVATGSAYAHGLIAVMRELGVEVDGSVVFHHDPVYDSRDPKQDSLGFLLENYGDVPFFSISVRQQYQFYALLQRVHPDFIIIRHGGLAPLASHIGIPAIPLGDESAPIGYQGIINLGLSILEVLSRKKFHQDVAEHVKLPYKKWWLDQKDPYILAKEADSLQTN